MTTLRESARGAESEGTTRAHWWILVVIAGAQLMVVLDSTIMIIALPSAQHALGFSNTDRQWVVTAYTLAFGGFLLLGGRISDMFGPKRTLMTGVLGFALASAVGGAAQTTVMLIGARGLQGLFGALLAPSVLSILTSTFTDPRERGRAFGILRHDRHRRLGFRADPGWLPHRVRRLALVPVRQPAHRRTRALRGLHHDPRARGMRGVRLDVLGRGPRVRRPGRRSSTGSVRRARAGGTPPTSSSR